MKLLPVLLLTFVVSLGVACASEPPFEDSVTTRVAETKQEARTYLNRGVAYSNLGQYERAIQSYDEAIRLNPEYATVYYNRGLAYEALGNSIKAEQDFAKSKEMGGP